MVVKFQIVVSYFMHLKFDSKVFTYVFVTGLILLCCFRRYGDSMGFGRTLRLRSERVFVDQIR